MTRIGFLAPVLCALLLFAPSVRAEDCRQGTAGDKPPTTTAQTPTAAPALSTPSATLASLTIDPPSASAGASGRGTVTPLAGEKAVTNGVVTATAAQAVESDEPAWSGRALLGVQHTSGSSEFLSLAAENGVNYLSGDTEVTLFAAARYRRSSFRSTQFDSDGNPLTVRRKSVTQSYLSEFNARLSFHTRAYWVARAGWEGDRNQAIDHRISLKAGAGVRLFTAASRELRVEALAGYLGEHHTRGESFHVPAAALTVALRQALGDAAEFDSTNHVVENLDATHDVLVTSRSTLNVRIVEQLGLAVSYQLTYDRRPSQALFDPSGGDELLSAPKGLNTHLIVSASLGW